MSEVYHDAIQLATKMCKACHQEKPLDQFPSKDKRRNTYRPQCKVCYYAKRRAQPKKPKPKKPPVQLTLQFTKVCRVCKDEKSLDQFIPNKDCRYGVAATCRDCTNKRIQRNHAAREPLTHRICTTCHQDKAIDQFQKDKTKTSGYREQCKECVKPRIRMNSHRHYANNPDQYRTRREQNRDKNIDYARNYHLEHREEQKPNKDRWRRNNPLKMIEIYRRRHAQKIKTTTQKVDYSKILERDGYWCHICDRPILPHHLLHFDHVIPLDRNGTHTENNIKPSHGVCNDRKGTKLLEEMDTSQRRGPDDLLLETSSIVWLY